MKGFELSRFLSPAAPGKLLGFLLICTSACATSSGYELELSKPTFVLPQFSGPYREREASLAPEEYETAERLRSLIDGNQRDQVLKELEQFYDIELSPAMLSLKAQVYFSLKMYDKAEETYLAVLKRMPELVRAHSDIAQLYLIKEKHDKARKHFAKAVSLGSNDAMVRGQLGYLNLTTYGAHSAISEYQAAMALEPGNRQWQQGLLAALSQARMYQAAQALLTELLKKHPRDPGLWMNQAALALQVDDLEKALVSLEMAILLGEDDAKNLETAARLHLQQNSHDRAMALLDQTMGRSSPDMASVNEYLKWFLQLGMWDRASHLLDSVRSNVSRMSEDDKSRYYLHRARIEAHKQNYSQADNYFTQALKHNPTDGEALLAQARFLVEQNDYIKAELLYVRAESLPGWGKEAMLGRAQMYIDMQDYESALKHLKLVYRKFPELVEMRENIEAIESIIHTRRKADEQASR